MLGFLAANLYLLVIIGIGGGLMWLVGALFWRLNMPPDDYPLLILLGMIAALVATYHIVKRLHTWLARYVR